MKIRTAQELLDANLLVKHYAGSHAYGTNIATSDVDFRGIFVADPINLRTPFFPIKEKEDSSEEDTKFHELSHFVRLACDCNPNIVETLWVDEKDVVFTSPGYQLLREAAPKLLSSKIAFTTSGYALAQLKRIKGHNKWITNPQPEMPPRQIDFVSLVHNFTSEKVFKINLEDYRDGYRLVPMGGEVYGLYKWVHAQTYSEDFTLNTAYVENTHELGVPLFVVKFNKEIYNSTKEKWHQYWTWKKNRNETRSALEEQHGYDCYTDDTEFLTNDGWKKFDEVSETDTVATFNPLSHKVEYQTPRERIESLYTGNLYHLTGYHVDTLVSANHNMYVREHSRTTKQTKECWQFSRAAELPETFDTLNVITPKINRQLLPKDVNEQIFQHVTMLDYLRLVGWYVSDGTMNFYETDKVKNMMISQSKPQSKLTQTLTKQINYGKIVCKQYIFEAQGLAKDPERRWVFERELSQLIYDDCGHRSSNKRLPKWCFFLTKREMTTLLVALLQGDGTKKNHQTHTYVYYTTNSLLADDVQRLALLCGFETSKYGPYENISTFETNNKMYHIHINMRPRKTRRHVRSSSVKKGFVTNQRIVCFMVDNHTLITRRNGHVGFHGNTKHAMHLVRLLRMGAEALQEGVLRVRRPDAEELLAIRNGAWTYEQVVEYAEKMDKLVLEELYPNTKLPKRPDIHLAAELILKVQDAVWGK